MASWALWLACLALLVARALIAAAESALYGTSDMRAAELITLRPRAGRRVQRQKTEREATAAAIRVGMAVCGCLAAAMAALTPPRLMDLSWLGSAPWLVWGSSVVTALFIGILASLLDVAGRTLASRAPDRWAMRLSGYVAFLVFTLYPPMRFLVGLINLVVRPFGGRIRFESPPPPLEELEKLLAAQAAGGQVDKGAPQLIRSIFELSDKRCRDVMVPRTEVVSVDVATPPAEILRLLGEEGHSRLPVFRDDVDRILGVLHTRDLIPLLQHPELIVLADVVRPATFIPWMKPIGDLLREMQKKRIHMAIVVDEYGGFMGIITLEDILEEIVGEIRDEFDVEKKEIERQPDGSFLVESGLEVADFSEAFGFALPEGDYETLGGFISSLAGAIPEAGERFQFNGWQFTVHSKEGARIGRVRINRPKGAAPPSKDKDGRPTL
jgi:putative hemolysin